MTSYSSFPLRLQDPLMPHLVELVARPEAQNAILAGGFGLRLRQAALRAVGATMLISEVPQARATQDLDLFLSVQVWMPPDEQATAFRSLLTELGYEEHWPTCQFRKPWKGGQNRIKLDLQARRPTDAESEVKVKTKKGVSQVGKGMGYSVSGYETPEGFAVEDSPQSISVAHGDTTAIVRVPHPYAWLNLKVRAAHDWLSEDRGELAPKPGADARLKHVFDVYLLNCFAAGSRNQRSRNSG